MNDKLKSVPVVGFLVRYPGLLLLLAAFVFLMMNDAAFQQAGPIVYAPVMFFMAVAVAVLIRHIFWRKTIDEFVALKQFNATWVSLPELEKLRWTLIVTLVLIVAASIVVAAVAN